MVNVNMILIIMYTKKLFGVKYALLMKYLKFMSNICKSFKKVHQAHRRVHKANRLVKIILQYLRFW
jgi:hypothetical protein